MKPRAVDDYFDPRRGDEPLQLERLGLDVGTHEPPRTNCFAVYRVESGSGRFWADASKHDFDAGMLLFFRPYQHLRFAVKRAVHADLIRFHANFLCIETFHAEVGCSGVLFNDVYGVPFVSLDEAAGHEVGIVVERLHREHDRREMASSEVSLAWLKILLVLASRRKAAAGSVVASTAEDPRHADLATLRELIESHYRTLHAPSDYARLMHVTPKTLGRLVRERLGKTPGDLIRERILTHAKWQLLHTLRPVKEIAGEVGFRDVLYFSRFFRKATGLSPAHFREFETRIRGGSNLSMPLSDAPILPSDQSSDTSTTRRERRRKR